MNGKGQVIGIIELGGGYRPADLKTYAKQIGVPAPKVTAVSVGHGKNNPTNANSADGEVMLDIEVAASIAPAQRSSSISRLAPPTRTSSAMTQAVHDSKNKPGVISVSWGGPEWPRRAVSRTSSTRPSSPRPPSGYRYDRLGRQWRAARRGPNKWDNKPHADFPASSPFALGCGATNIQVSHGAIVTESVWNQGEADTQDDSFGSSGGGVSESFPVPTYQATAGVPVNISTKKKGRGCPM